MHRKAPASVLSFFLLSSPILASPGEAAVCNANHIFTAIHSSMRQWGGSLNHNGMSLFLATVPEGTQLYHGTSDPDFIKGMQWLAFEPEHALIFARPRGRPRDPPPGEGEGSFPVNGEAPDVEDAPHDKEGWKHHGPPFYKNGPEHEHGPPPPRPYHDKPAMRPPQGGKDSEHPRPPHDHGQEPPSTPLERKLCNGTEHPPPTPPTPNHERGPRKHREHGPPPPLPPGHIYKPYPPPPRQYRPYKGPKRSWNPEHRYPPPPDPHDRPQRHHDPPPPEQHERVDHHESIGLRSSREKPKISNNSPWKRQTQQPLQDPMSSPEDRIGGYLHTYTPTHDLHLLYIDGLSAGKTSNGTLDTQDRLLLNLTAGDIGGPMGGERARANGLCELASTIWEGKIDGILRLEGGFEIILCDFEKHLQRTDVVGVGSGSSRSRGLMGGWEYVKAITARYHGIGGSRVRVDYERFVSVFQYEGVKGLWDNDVQSDVRMPRLTNVSPKDLITIRNDVTSLILGKDWADPNKGRNWQAVADMVVARYSTPLHHITANQAFQKDKAALAAYLQGLLRPFIDATARNASLETARCVAQFLPHLPSLNIPPASLTPLAHRAIHTVATRICDTLLTSLSIAVSPTPHSSFSTVYAEHAVEAVQELVDWLSWTSWKDCGTCRDEEVCFIPIWPTGTLEDHAKPQCRGEEEVEGRTGYWGRRMGPPPGDGQKGGKGWKMQW